MSMKVDCLFLQSKWRTSKKILGELSIAKPRYPVIGGMFSDKVFYKIRWDINSKKCFQKTVRKFWLETPPSFTKKCERWRCMALFINATCKKMTCSAIYRTYLIKLRGVSNGFLDTLW